MAYCNWGGRVWRNREPRHDREDTSLAETGMEGAPRPRGMDHHIVLGDGPVRLAVVKTWPELWAVRNGVAREFDMDPEWSCMDGTLEREGVIDGHAWQAVYDDWNGPTLHVRLTEPDGTIWQGWSAYGRGAGFEYAEDWVFEDEVMKETGHMYRSPFRGRKQLLQT